MKIASEPAGGRLPFSNGVSQILNMVEEGTAAARPSLVSESPSLSPRGHCSSSLWWQKWQVKLGPTAMQGLGKVNLAERARNGGGCSCWESCRKTTKATAAAAVVVAERPLRWRDGKKVTAGALLAQGRPGSGD